MPEFQLYRCQNPTPDRFQAILEAFEATYGHPPYAIRCHQIDLPALATIIQTLGLAIPLASAGGVLRDELWLRVNDIPKAQEALC